MGKKDKFVYDLIFAIMTILFETISVQTPKREILVDITSEVRNLAKNSNIKEGICRVYVPHTTAGITINENADPAVKDDIIAFLHHLVPVKFKFKHLEGNSDSHIKASLTGSSIYLMIHNKKLILGTWQGIFLAEFDGPRSRKVFIQIEGITS